MMKTLKIRRASNILVFAMLSVMITSLASAKKEEKKKEGISSIPAGQELVNLDFPEMTDIQDIIKAIAVWTGKNVILDSKARGKVRIISPKKVTKEEAYQAFLSALSMLGLTTVETGKVIKIMQTRSAKQDNLKTFKSSSWAPRTDEMITQLIPLKYLDARTIQSTLSRIVSSNSMIAYQPTNTLIISDSGFKVRRILEIIKLLDVQTQQPKVMLVPIKNADAKTIADKVNQIVKSSGGARSASSVGGAALGAFKIMTDERTNSVIVFGPPRTIKDIKSLIKKFDVPLDDPTVQATIHVRPLDFADAKKLASTLSSLTQSSRSSSSSRRRPPGTAKGKIDSVANLGDGVKITADESTNSLLITGSKSAYDTINSIIRKLDSRRSQLFVEVDILDLNEDNNFKFGTSIFAGSGSVDGNGNPVGTKSVIGWEASQMGTLVSAMTSTTPSAQTVTSAAQAFTQSPLTVAVLAGQSINIPGLGSITPGGVLNFLKADANTKILASPHILTSNNEEASISVGEQFFIQKTTTTAAASTVDYAKEDVSTVLTIKPNISYSDYVTIKMSLESVKVKSLTKENVPTLATRKTKQLVTVKNGQTIVISGLVNNEELETFNKIPLLGDIPVLGWLFRNSTIKKNRSNLVIFLTPYVVHGAADLAAIYKSKLKERDQYLEKIFGSSYKDSDLYKRLPNKKDGGYKPSKFDRIEDKRLKVQREEMLKAMGGDEFDAIEPAEFQKKLERPETLPLIIDSRDSAPAAKTKAPVEPKAVIEDNEK